MRYFVTIAGTGNMRQAAELLRISPAALSKAMKALESEAGARLFVPAGRGIAITGQGKLLAERAARVLREIDGIRDELRGQAQQARPLRIGSFEVFTTYFLGPLLAGHLAGTPLELHELVPGLLEKALSDGQIDLGITYLPVPSADLDHLQAGQVEMGIYARRGAFPGRPSADLPFVVPITPVSGSPNRIRGLDGWPDDRVARDVCYRVTLMESALELCRRGLAAAYLPRFVVELHNRGVREAFQLVARPAPAGLKPGRQAVYLAKRKSDAESRAARLVARAIRKVTSP